MLFVATKDWKYLLAGLAAGVLAAVAAYFLFSHVKVRVEIWQDPFQSYEGGGYQVAQSLFAIGLLVAGNRPVSGFPKRHTHCVSRLYVLRYCGGTGGNFCHLCNLDLHELFYCVCECGNEADRKLYRDVALGLGCMYAVQVFLTVGGRHEDDPYDGSYPALYQHRRQFHSQYPDVIFHYSGTLFIKRR